MKISLRFVGKMLQAISIAALMVGLVQGVYGDMWGELYLFIGGIVVFIIGRRFEKRWEKQHRSTNTTTTLQSVDSR